jgi:hypothetical protein
MRLLKSDRRRGRKYCVRDGFTGARNKIGLSNARCPVPIQPRFSLPLADLYK